MTRGLVVPLSALLLFCSGVAGSVAAEPGTTPQTATITFGDFSLTPWRPSDSYQGGAQFDSRLDTPVKVWRAGIPLRDLFADLTRQTGVGFDFWPPGTDDARVCVTLYLNPQQPPSLRAVIAQLSWVTGCAFACADGPGDTRSYYLLGTSIAQGAAEKLAAQAEARREQLRGDFQARRDADRETAAAALAESRSALGLSRDEAVVRYRGVNDALLLNLLDPSRRAALALITALPEADTEDLLSGQPGMLSREWSEWSADQQAALKQALGLEQNWPQTDTVYIMVGMGRGGSVTAMVRGGGRPQALGRVQGLLSSGDVRGGQEIALRRLLGEINTPQQEAALRTQQQQAQDAARAARQQQRVQQTTQAQAAARTLSPERESQLASLALPPAAANLWQLQEAVATATGMDVISDCFSLPTGPSGRRFRRRNDMPSAPANALDALSVACAGRPGGPGGPGGRFGRGPGGDLGGQGGELGLVWGDAGSFLRFRSQHPDIWRGAMLPADVQAQLDGWFEPYLGRATAPPPASNTPLAGDIEKMSWLAGRLNDLQVELGGAVIYEDPADPMGSRRQAMRRATLQQLAMRLPLMRFLATFTPDQWARVRAEGLRWGYDLTPDQQSADISRMVTGAVPDGRLKDVVIQISEAEAQTIEQRDGTKRTIPAGPVLRFTLDGKPINEMRLDNQFGPFGMGRGMRMGPGPGGPPQAPPAQ